MKLGVAVVIGVATAACGSDGPSCKDAVESAAKTMYGTSANKERTTMMIGTCAQDEWPSDMRRCVASVQYEPDLVACFAKHKKKSKEALVRGEADDPEVAARKMEDFANRMCQCKDKSCGDKVNDEMTKWGAEMAQVADKNAKPDREATQRFADIMKRYTECYVKIATIDYDAPTLVGVQPTAGLVDGGSYVAVRGKAFTRITRSAKVYFGSRQATVIRFASDNELIVQLPPGRSGDTVDVVVVFDPGGTQRLTGAFTYVDSAP